ncbi:MAG: hypothetical protein IJM76_06445 [Lachnospiraceae bacterium]|nr:hypothetical protein [Lachnospiraceae bacterium]
MEYAKQIAVIRELAKQYMEIAVSDRHVKMRKRFRDSNDLKIVRPPLLIDEIPWDQMNYEGALDLQCEDPKLKEIERFLRQGLFREKYFRCDNFIEPYYIVQKAFSSTGNGLTNQTQEETISAEHTDIKSHYYHDVLEDESALDAFHLPVITAYPEKDRENLAFMREVLGDSMPVVLRGHSIYYAPWDVIPRLRGVTPILMDMYDRPEYLHRIIQCFTDGMRAEMDQMEALGLYDPRLIVLHCTPADITVEGQSQDEPYLLKDIWFRTMAQMFSSVSPAMLDEFDVQYSKPLAERCAYTYYGCCEPLHDRIDVIKQIKNLRKIGVSPWAKLEESAEQIGGNYVFARKPNPAHVAIRTDREEIRKEIEDSVKVCQKYGCPQEIVLKDISTVGDRPENLIEWAETASEVLDAYYGPEC